MKMAANAPITTATTAAGRGTRTLRKAATSGDSANVRSIATASGMNISRPKYKAATVAMTAMAFGYAGGCVGWWSITTFGALYRRAQCLESWA